MPIPRTHIQREAPKRPVLVALILLALAAAAPGVSQEPPPAQTTNTGVPEIPTPKGIETAEDEHGHVHQHRNHAALFVGGSRSGSLDGFTIGGEYEFRFHKMLGVGVEGEYVTGDLRETIFAFPFHFHPGAGFRLAAGPGFERAPEAQPETEQQGASRTVTEFLWRLTIAYDFAVRERFTLSPSLSVDFAGGRRIWVYGISFGVGF